ncbi:Transcription factor [Savitreella phatthalungensis]
MKKEPSPKQVGDSSSIAGTSKEPASKRNSNSNADHGLAKSKHGGAETSKPNSASTAQQQTKPKGHHDSEPNPFEQSFRGGDSKPPQLPGVANLTSPNGNPSNAGQLSGWSSFGSLRNGPLSPAMLLGPTGLSGFDGTLRTGLTPNESSIRTGLTPRGDTGPYPMPSPNTQALMGLMDSSNGIVPGGVPYGLSSPGGGQYGAESLYNRPHMPSSLGTSSVTADQAAQQDKNSVQDTNAAANGLFMLAQHSQEQNNQHRLHAQQQHGHHVVQHSHQLNHAQHMGHSHHGAHSVHPNQSHQLATGLSAGEGGLPNGSIRGGGGVAAQNGIRPAQKTARRKSGPEDGAHDTKSAKRGRVSKGPKLPMSESEDEDDEDGEDDNIDSDNKKPETDEEKRRNFLERNRQAALKCRQRKKQWLANLQAKVEFYGQENDQLTTQVSSLREEIVNLKALLMAHKDCPVTAAHGGSLGF